MLLGPPWEPIATKGAPKIGRTSKGHPRRPKIILNGTCMDFTFIFRDFGSLQIFFKVFGKASPFNFETLQIFLMILARFRHQYFIHFASRQDPQRTSTEPGTKRTPQNMIRQIAIRIMPSTANERFPQTALAQNGGRRCHAAWRIQ